MMTENVIGAENRELVTVTQQFPYKAICCLIITAGNSTRLLGTGWFIHNSVLATAAHNVYDSRYGGWAQSIEVFPGRNGSSTPFGSQVVPRSRLRTNSNWISTGSPDFDYGAILLSQPFSQNLGNFALDLSTTIAGARVNIAGYPRDIPFQGHPMFTMWWHAQQVSRVSERAIFYSHDTSVGQSGSPVWIKSGEERVAVGVHTSGPTAGSPFNSATRINATVLNRFNGWVAEAG
jgi:glutamyl endopeptidase